MIPTSTHCSTGIMSNELKQIVPHFLSDNLVYLFYFGGYIYQHSYPVAKLTDKVGFKIVIASLGSRNLPGDQGIKFSFFL